MNDKQEIPEESIIEKRVRGIMGDPPNELPNSRLNSREIVRPKPEADFPADTPTEERQFETESRQSEDEVVNMDKSSSVNNIDEQLSNEPADLVEEHLDDETTSNAVDEIVRQESDIVLDSEDAQINDAFSKSKKSKKEKIKELWSKWWSNPKTKWATIIFGVLVFIGLFTLPITRYFLLNTVGVRSSASITVLDDSTILPLKNVKVSISGQTVSTNDEGLAKLSNLKLGRTKLIIKKGAFALIEKPVTLGWGSNPMGSVNLQAVGAQIAIMVQDWLSNKPITKAEASSGEASAIADKDGKITLTIEPTDEQMVPITVKADNYREEKIKLDINSKEIQKINMVAARKHFFISKRSGKFDLYQIDVDGKNEKLIFKGTGSERDDIVLVAHPDSDVLAMVSTRENTHDKDGFLLSTLTTIDINNKENGVNPSVTQSQKIQILGWNKTKLIYVNIAAGTSATNPKRHKIMAYDYKTKNSQEIAYANYFNDMLIIGDNIYYSPTDYVDGNTGVGFYKIGVDGNNKQKIINDNAWNIYRTGYDVLNIAVSQEWYQFKLNDTKATKLPGGPAINNSRIYVDSPDKKRSVWVDNRDGKGVLVVYNLNSKVEKSLRSQSGLQYPVRWISNNSLIYRISTEQETADYIINIDGGESRKIQDVTNTGGASNWYYYH